MLLDSLAGRADSGGGGGFSGSSSSGGGGNGGVLTADRTGIGGGTGKGGADVNEGDLRRS